MVLRRNTEVNLGPTFEVDAVPLVRLLGQFMAAEFDPARCGELLCREIERSPRIAKFFDVAGIERRDVFARPDLLFPAAGPWQLSFRLHREPSHTGLRERSSCVRVPLSSHSAAATSSLLREVLEASNGDSGRECLEALGLTAEAAAALVMECPGPEPAWREATAPGIYRREHASLLFRSRAAAVLVDPICLVGEGLPNISKAPRNLGVGQLDAILLTHGHGDHWHLPSVTYWAGRAHSPVLVPIVPTTNLLCSERFEDSLRQTGQQVVPLAWGATFTVADIEIDVLPFFGEQPTRDPPGAVQGLRSWGNCYRITTPDYSALVLADAGADPLGDMKDVVSESAQKRGPLDVILSSLREFSSPFFDGLAHYWVSLPFAELTVLFRSLMNGTLPNTTAGPAGAAELCRIGRSHYFLPYADGFEGIGRPIEDIGWGAREPAEAEAVQRVRTFLGDCGAHTRAIDWRIGDAAVFDRGAMSLLTSD